LYAAPNIVSAIKSRIIRRITMWPVRKRREMCGGWMEIWRARVFLEYLCVNGRSLVDLKET